MTKQIFTILFIFFSISAKSQADIKLSMLPDTAKFLSKEVVNNFFNAYSNGEDITSFLTSNEANFAGKMWLPISDFKGFINQLIPRPAENIVFNYYTIDDIDKNEELKKKTIELSRVFNNYSILADGSINGRKASIVLNSVETKMKIYSITIWDIPLKSKSPSPPVMPTDTIDIIDLSLVIPAKFYEVENANHVVTYTLKGETGRDAKIEIIYNEKQADLNLLTYKWAEYVTSSYKRSDFDISYLPNGYIYKYEVLDENEVVNKGITAGFENNDYIIFIQYFGLKEAYNQHWKEIDYMLRNVILL